MPAGRPIAAWRVPTIADEDAKRRNRERESLVGERTRINNRIKCVGLISTRWKTAASRLGAAVVADWVKSVAGQANQ